MHESADVPAPVIKYTRVRLASNKTNSLKVLLDTLLPQGCGVPCAVQRQVEPTDKVGAPMWVFARQLNIDLPFRLRVEISSLHIAHHYVKSVLLPACGVSQYKL